MKFEKIVYWVSTGVMCAIFLFSATMYFTKYEMVQGFYQHLGFPVWMIYPSAVLKVLGVVAILSNKSNLLREWAYAGFTFDAAAAIAAHYISDGAGYEMSLLAFMATLLSRYLLSRQS